MNITIRGKTLELYPENQAEAHQLKDLSLQLTDFEHSIYNPDQERPAPHNHMRYVRVSERKLMKRGPYEREPRAASKVPACSG